jgi:hypothetical protein
MLEQNFLVDGWKATCSCGWVSRWGDGKAVLFKSQEAAQSALERHVAQEAETQDA